MCRQNGFRPTSDDPDGAPMVRAAMDGDEGAQERRCDDHNEEQQSTNLPQAMNSEGRVLSGARAWIVRWLGLLRAAHRQAAGRAAQVGVHGWALGQRARARVLHGQGRGLAALSNLGRG